MAHALCLQDWITVTSNVAATLTQPEPGWLDVADFQDFAFYVEVANNSSSTTLNIQASPTKDEAFFGATILGGNAYIATFPLATGNVQTVTVVRWQTTSTNQLPARWLRWQVSFPVAGGAPSFRIWVVANQAGRRWSGASTLKNTQVPPVGSITPVTVRAPQQPIASATTPANSKRISSMG